jgi:hypothetical protein
MSHDNSALQPSNYNELPREAKKTADSTADRIYKYYHNNKTRVELSDEENRIRERWEKAWFLLSHHRTQKQVVDLIVKLFNVGKSVAYNDVWNAMKLFGNPQADVKDAKRAIAETMALKGADRCWKNGDMDGYFKFTKEYKEINQLDLKEDASLAAVIKKLRPTQVIIIASDKDLESEAEKIENEFVQDIDYTEFNEGKDTEG